jgi:hypothetical protein
MTMARPAHKVTPTAPGSDVAAETAAALAAASLVFAPVDSAYSAVLLSHARQLFTFADSFRGKYSDTVPVQGAYDSYSFADELVWAAAWLHRATGEAAFLTYAEAAWSQSLWYVPGSFNWDDKAIGATLMLAVATGSSRYTDIVSRYVQRWMPGGGVTYTPKVGACGPVYGLRRDSVVCVRAVLDPGACVSWQGLASASDWGSLRAALNSALIACIFADRSCPGCSPATRQGYLDWAGSQLHYALGSTGRSFVVGFGVNPPVREHHRGASCVRGVLPCNYGSALPNPNVLRGALVGGPAVDDSYSDVR